MQSQDTDSVCTVMLAVLNLEMSVGSTDKDIEKKSTVDCSIPGGCFFICVVVA